MELNRDGRNSEDRGDPLWPLADRKLLQALDLAASEVFQFKINRFNVEHFPSPASPDLHSPSSLAVRFPEGMTNFGYGVDCLGAGATFDLDIGEIFIVNL